jgi:phage protein D
MRANMLVDDKQIYLQSLTSPAGYQQELVAMEIILRKYIARNSKLLDWASAELFKKNSGNPLYEYLENGCTDRFFEQFIQLSPTQEPAEKRNWTIAKDNVWDSSMGWEWIFLADMCSVR